MSGAEEYIFDDFAEQTLEPTVEVNDESFEQDETKEGKHKRQQRQRSKFNIKTLIHYLNTCYGNRFVFKDGQQLGDKQQGKIIVDISKIEALDEFKFIMYAIDIVNKKLTRKERWDKITHSVFDFKLRGVLTAINDNELSTAESKKYKDKDYKLFMEKIIPQLHFDEQHTFNMEEAKQVMLTYLRSQAIRYKLLNKLFPHPEINTNADEKKRGVFLNKMYIQQMSMFHDDIIKVLFTHKDITHAQLFAFVCQKLAEQHKDKITKDVLLKFDYNRFKLNKPIKDLDKDVVAILKQANSERNIITKYIDYFNVVGLSNETYEKYKEIANSFITMSAQLEKLPVSSYKDFINMFITVFKLVNEPLNYRFNVNAFVKDSKLYPIMQFTQKFKQVIGLLLTTDTTTINYNGNMFMCKVHKVDANGNDIIKTIEGEIIQENKYVPQRVFGTLAKIGLYVEGNDIRSDISAGIGCIIMDYIREQAEKHIKPTNKVRKCVYIMC